MGLDFRILLEICRRTWFHDHPLAKDVIGSQPVVPWGSDFTQLDVVESIRTDDPPSAGLCPRFPWPRWCHWHRVLWSLPARVGPCASELALPVIRTAQVQPWGHHFVDFDIHHLFLHLALWSAWRDHRHSNSISGTATCKVYAGNRLKHPLTPRLHPCLGMPFDSLVPGSHSSHKSPKHFKATAVWGIYSNS